jgi:hypothetical protein
MEAVPWSASFLLRWNVELLILVQPVRCRREVVDFCPPLDDDFSVYLF